MIDSNDIRPPLLYKDRRGDGTTVLRQCQLVELHLLYVFDKICKQNDLKYFLCGGTLLGAVRHGGFIPWDDDLDVGMPIEDFRRFKRIAKTELPDDVAIQWPGDEPLSSYMFGKLRDAYSFYGELHPRVPTAAHSGIFIDIFPFEDSPNIKDAYRRYLGRLIAGFYGRMIFARYESACRSLLLAPYYLFCATMFKLAHSFLRMLWSVLKAIYTPVAVCPILEFFDRDTLIQKSWLKDMKLHKFEDGEFPIPHHAEECLHQLYGEWQVLPPENQRRSHARIIDPFRSSGHKKSMEFSFEGSI